jgi:hypothetical protein
MFMGFRLRLPPPRSDDASRRERNATLEWASAGAGRVAAGTEASSEEIEGWTEAEERREAVVGRCCSGRTPEQERRRARAKVESSNIGPLYLEIAYKNLFQKLL